MLLLGPRQATYVPLGYFGAGALFAGVGLVALAKADAGARNGALMGSLLGAVLLSLATSACRRVTASGDELVVRGFRKRRALVLSACAFGVRLKRGRTPSYAVFVTDGVASEELGEWSSERAARSTVARFETLFGGAEHRQVGGPAKLRRRRERAQREVAEVESDWKSRIAIGEKAVADYYQSRTWRLSKYAIVGGVLLYILGASLYFHLTGSD